MIFGEFSDVFPPETDGVGTVVKNYATHLQAGGDIAYFLAPRAEDPVGSRPFPVILFGGIKLPGEPYRMGLPSLDRGFGRTVNEIPFDLVHAHSPFGAGRAARRIARRRGIPLVATFHSKYYDDFLAKTHSKLLARLATRIVVDFYRTCDEVWTVTDAAAEVLRSYGYEGPLRVMPNGTDPWEPTGRAEALLSSTFGEGSEGPLFLYVGQHNWKKNIRVILEGVALYRKEGAPCRLLFVGQGPDREAIEAEADRLGLGNVTRFLGHVSDRDTLLQVYAAADLFLFPSLYDTAGLVVKEAASAGTASIIARGSCAAEGTEDGVNAFHCEPTPESMAAVIASALPRARKVGEEARRTIPTLWGDVIRDARARYCELIEEKKKSKA